MELESQKKGRKTEKIFEGIIVKNLSKFYKNYTTTKIRRSMKHKLNKHSKNKPGQRIIKLLKTSDKTDKQK